MPVKKLRKFLDDNEVKYITVNHSPAYTAREVAASAFVPRREFAKATIVKLGGAMAIAVVPASRHVDLEKLASEAGVGSAVLAGEDEFQDAFPGCEVGAMPPFGNLYDMPTYVDTLLQEDDEIAFNAGTHTQIVRLAYDDYVKLVRPKVCSISVKE
jgi:Ala-tRNA(Pro) deacylase